MTIVPDQRRLFPVSATEIEQLVTAFYRAVRSHPTLGPVFLAAIGSGKDDWAQHEAKICAFWRSAILKDGSYSGNPMQVHLANSDILPEHFQIWLTLFEQVAHEMLTPLQAESFCALAQRIGKGLSFGLINFRKQDGAPPVLV